MTTTKKPGGNAALAARVKAIADKARLSRTATLAAPEEASAEVVGDFERRSFSVAPVGLAGLQYTTAYQIWDRFPNGTRLELRLEPGHPKDKHAVQVLVDGVRIAYVHRDNAQQVSHYLGMGMEYDCFVVQRDAAVTPYHQVKVQISFGFFVPKGALNLTSPNSTQFWGNPPA
jgi:hypothetical protein